MHLPVRVLSSELSWDKASFTLSFFYPKIHIAAMPQGNTFAGFEKFLGLGKKVQQSSPQKGSPYLTLQ